MASWKDTIKKDTGGGWKSTIKPEGADSVVSSFIRPTREEMPEWLGYSDRFMAQNFAANPEEKLNFLKRQYPQAIFRNVDGEIQGRMPNEDAWRKLDPSWTEANDWGKDLGDVVADTAGGVAEGMATAAAATAASPAGPAAMWAAGSAANGATSAGVEAVRQAAGRVTGVNENMDPGGIVTSGAVGAAAPLAFGLDFAPKQVISEFAKRGVNLTEEQVKQLGKGGLRRLWDGIKYGASEIGGALNGFGGETLRSYSRQMDKADELAKSPIAQQEFYNDAISKTRNFTNQKGRELGEQVSAEAQRMPIVDIASAKDAYKKYLGREPEPSDFTPDGFRQFADSLQHDYNYAYGNWKQNPETINVPRVQFQAPTDTLVPVGGSTVVETAESKAAQEAFQNRKKDPLEELAGLAEKRPPVQTRNVPQTGNVKKPGMSNDPYLNFGMNEQPGPYDPVDTSAYGKTRWNETHRSNVNLDPVTLMPLSPMREAPDQVTGQQALDIQGLLRHKANFDSYNKTPAEKVAAESYHAIKDSFEKSSDAMPVLKDAYRNKKIIDDTINPALQSAGTYEKLLLDLRKGKKIDRSASIARLQEMGLDLRTEKDVADALRFARETPLLPISGDGTTSTSRSVITNGVLGGAGFAMSGPAGSAAMLGGHAVLTSPWLHKGMIKTTKAAESAADSKYLKPLLTPIMTEYQKEKERKSGWNLVD